MLDHLPQTVFDDAELGDFRDDPLLRRVGPLHPLAGHRVLDVAQPIPDQAADVELVVAQAGSPLGMAPARMVGSVQSLPEGPGTFSPFSRRAGSRRGRTPGPPSARFRPPSR